MTAGFLFVAVVSNLFGLGDIFNHLLGGYFTNPADGKVIAIEFPWRILFGTVVTAAIALCFRTRDSERLGTPALV
jgi:hypothetical protein